MNRRRNVKRSLPALEVVSFSSASKRKVELTTPVVGEGIGQQKEINDGVIDHSSTSVELSYPNEIESTDGDDEQEDNTVSGYARKQQRAAKHWSEITNEMLTAVIESECVSDEQLCTRCTQDPATFRCLKCGAGALYCEACVAAVHNNRNYFHVVEQWKASVLNCLFLAIL